MIQRERVKEYREPTQIYSISLKASELQQIRAKAIANGMTVSKYFITSAI